MKESKISPNSVSLAREFAVLSRIALWGYDANMTLGNTKNVDILVSNPKTNRMYQLEVKTRLHNRKRPTISRLHGRFEFDWIMHAKHEAVSRRNLWHCFVSIAHETKAIRYFVVPSNVVAAYVRAEHRLWLDAKPGRKDTEMRVFRLGFRREKYGGPTPIAEKYENNWGFSAK
ncbi:hypothetical protein JW916_02635 [Candidatus Sumerlaeota bacterium]|nr:hypothetical protein [Candidatus Sumerlaeota bacterium]